MTILLVSSFLMGCQAASRAASPEPAAVTHTYAVSDASILNPERGFFTPYELPGSAGFSPVRATGNTLVHLNIRLDNWRETDIPKDILEGLQTNFADIRDAGIKAIIRFAYNQGPYPDSEPDASKKQILGHIEQLKPLLRKNSDIIAWVEAGFIGAWGEWHTSTNGLDNITDKREILNALLAAIPDRYVQVRYPANIIEMYPNAGDAAKAHVAHHNDCFLSSDTDVGTYERDGVVTIERDQKYLAELTRFTPMSGETCAPNPPRSECESALQEMALLHFSAINEAYHKGILRSWEEGGCRKEINDRLGYRLSLTAANFNEQVRPGGVLNLTVKLQNAGFASLINGRPLYVILVPALSKAGGKDVGAFRVKLDIDPRSWEPGTVSFTAKLHVPSNAPEGAYHLALWLPDASESLQKIPQYSVQLANENIWDESTGLNMLGNVSIAESAGGERERGKDFSVIESSSTGVTAFPTAAPAQVSLPKENSPSTPDPAVISTNAALISNVKILNRGTILAIMFGFEGKVEDYNAFQVFLDMDRNLSTGYSVNGVGADFLLENGTLNIYSGGGTDWAWKDTQAEGMFDNVDNMAQWMFDLNGMAKPAAIDFVCQLVNTNWDAAFVTKKMTYTLK